MHTSPTSSSRRGGALLLAIAGIMLLGLIGMGLTSLLSSSGRIIGDTLPQAAYLAESGVTILRHRLRGLSPAAQMLEIESLHGKRLTLSASAISPDLHPDLGTVELRLYPHWFQTGATTSSLPVHAGGCRAFADTEHAFVAFRSDGSTTRFLLQGSGVDSSTAFPSLRGATICFVGRYRSATLSSSTTPSSETSRWSLSLTTANPDDFQTFPDTNGLIGLIDATGVVSSKWFIYETLHRNGQLFDFENIHPAHSFPLDPSDFSGKDLVLGRHLSVETLAQTPAHSRDAAFFSLNLFPLPTPLIRIR